ncbi:protein involved in gliding motility GldB [Tenacibaculum mesophilum]|uniref:Gliding motility lipoprotein GldB n=1 Tax=Tenacibaculum mesophilum TaxID=104268 RepID=A0ABM7CIA0_9FLAO|nr:gliding motility lipoprotein GldB [Tenacibaculum mesophilum]AZJ33548.1 gliding motility lipoprotein GldB [Tenacibaculum mesophilum]QFS28788.1 gliding motility lipoprotein GldB [Tenacibaculum mesophilum]SHF58653.1 protein involved in gliding motility GldB [Tenacibaculum mesophilum]
MRKILALVALVFISFSCKNEESNKLDVDVSNISVNVNLERFDVDFYTTKTNELTKTKEKYPMLFPPQPDSVWINKINNKDEQELFTETQKVFSDVEEEKEQLISLFKHVKYYNPRFVSPKVITMLTNIDYNNRIVYTDSLLLVSLDAYLGEKHEFYNDYPAYVKQNNTKKHIVVDVAKAIVGKQMLPSMARSFIDKMIYRGKKMYLLDAYLPNVADAVKIGYSQKKLEWAESNEEQIWMYFIEKDLLYSTSKDVDKRFLDLAPFSKFYMEEDSQSPGRIGEWIGWQIVSSYMQKNDVSLHQLLQTSEEEIFKNSRYKPKR